MRKAKNAYMVFILLITIFVIILGFIKNTGAWNWISDGKSVENTVAIDGEVNNIDISLDATDLEFEYGEALSVYYKYPENKKPSIDLAGGELKIRDNENFSFGNNFKDDYKMIVILPEGCDITNVKIDVDAGNVVLDDFDCENIKIDADAGNVEVNNSKASKVVLSADAGNIHMDNLEAEKLIVDENLGNIELFGGKIPDIKVESDLGNVELEGEFDTINAECSLGNISVNTKQDVNDLTIHLSGTGSKKVNGEKWDK